MSVIDAKRMYGAFGLRKPGRSAPRTARAIAVFIMVAITVFAFSPRVFAGRASTGKLAFYPCTKCHPVFVDANDNPTKPLPNGMKKHEIELQAHDILGVEGEACLACHDDPTRNPGKLKLPDGSLVDIKGDVSRVCQRCHFEKYEQWKAGIHGKHQSKCSAAGCHNPHTPSWIYVAALPPFQGTGFEAKAVGADRQPFKPLASPPPAPAVETPLWLRVMASLGSVASIGLIGYLTLGRSTR